MRNFKKTINGYRIPELLKIYRKQLSFIDENNLSARHYHEDTFVIFLFLIVIITLLVQEKKSQHQA